MANIVYEAYYAGHPVTYSFRYPATRTRFRNYVKRKKTDDFNIRVDEEQLQRGLSYFPEGTSESYIEFQLLTGLTSIFLLKHHCAIFHCVSFIYKGYAWLLTAPSGTGKTTQYMNWKSLYSDEIMMISGDKPVLERISSKTINVHPSPWNGKERIANKITAPLGGIIYLEQGDHNEIQSMPAKDGLINIFLQFMGRPETHEEVFSLASIVECMFMNYPVWKYVNQGNTESTILLRETIRQYMEKHYDL